MKISWWLGGAGCLMVAVAVAGSPEDLNGLYAGSADPSAPVLRMADGSTNHLGARADIKINEAHVYADNNLNTEFEARLETSAVAVGPASLVLRVADRGYPISGWAGRTGGPGNVLWVNIHRQDEAEAAARWLGVDCPLRAPPGYKLFAQFLPEAAVYATNGPVVVKFALKNLDGRSVIFQRGGRQRGSRDNQYGFSAMYQGAHGPQPVPDTGNPVNFGGLTGMVKLDAGQVYADEIDLKKWFGFDRPGSYFIHGYFAMTFYRPAPKGAGEMPSDIMWEDYASADFQVVVK